MKAPSPDKRSLNGKCRAVVWGDCSAYQYGPIDTGYEDEDTECLWADENQKCSFPDGATLNELSENESDRIGEAEDTEFWK